MQSQKPDPRRKTSYTIRSRCACVWYMVDDIWWIKTPFVWSLFVCKFFWEHGYISFFFFLFSWTFMCPTYFFLKSWTFMCPYFLTFFSPFFIIHVSFVTKYWERNHHIMWSFYFVGCKKWYNANFSQKHSKGVYGVHVNLDHESMKRILPRVITIWQCSMQRQAAYV